MYRTELGQAPTFQARPRDTDHLGPSNLAATILDQLSGAYPLDVVWW